MTTAKEDMEFRNRIEHLEAVLQDLDDAVDPAAQARIRDIVQTLLEFHGTGLARILDHVGKAGEPGQSILRSIGADDLASSLLVLHGLHPLDLETRVRLALDKVRSFVHGHGGSVELLSIREGSVRLRITSDGQGCHSTPGKLKQAVEDAIYTKAPDITAIQIEGVTDGAAQTAAAFIPVEQLLVRQ
jgi:Fe-S cluster biogenesis protein NfuA